MSATEGDARMGVPFAAQTDVQAAQDAPVDETKADEEPKVYDKEYVDKLTKEAKTWREKFQSEKAARADAEQTSKQASTLEDRLAKAEQRAAEADARALRRDIAMDHGLSKEDAVTLEGISDGETLNAIAARFAFYRTELAKAVKTAEENAGPARVGVKASSNGNRNSGGSSSSEEALGRMLFGA